MKVYITKLSILIHILMNFTTILHTSNNHIPNVIHTLVRGVIIHQNHILCAYDPRLLTEHKKPIFYYLPGGHIEFQELATEALMREIQEELNIPAIVNNFLGVFERSWLGKPLSITCHTHEITLVFAVTLPSLDNQDLSTIISQEKNVAFQWIPITEISQIDLRPSLLKKRLNRWITTTPHTMFESQMHL